MFKKQKEKIADGGFSQQNGTDSVIYSDLLLLKSYRSLKVLKCPIIFFFPDSSFFATLVECSTFWATCWCSSCWASRWNWCTRALKWGWFTCPESSQVNISTSQTAALQFDSISSWSLFSLLFFFLSFTSCSVCFIFLCVIRFFGQFHLWSSQCLGRGIRGRLCPAGRVFHERNSGTFIHNLTGTEPSHLVSVGSFKMKTQWSVQFVANTVFIGLFEQMLML